MRNIEEDILELWGFLWQSGMIGSLEKTDHTGKKKVTYFVNDFGKQIFNLLV